MSPGSPAHQRRGERKDEITKRVIKKTKNINKIGYIEIHEELKNKKIKDKY